MNDLDDQRNAPHVHVVAVPKCATCAAFHYISEPPERAFCSGRVESGKWEPAPFDGSGFCYLHQEKHHPPPVKP